MNWSMIFTALAAGGSVGSAIASALSARAAAKSIEVQAQTSSRQIEVTRELGKLQTWASVVSTSRQRWIDAMRDDVAEFLTLDASYKGFDRNPSREEAENIKAHRAARELLRRQMLLLRRLRLRMNPADDDHAELYQLMRSLLSRDQEESGETAELIVSLTQNLLKLEWDRVRREAAGEAPPNVKSTSAPTVTIADHPSQQHPSV